jgi:DNA-binding SARP family transcriptional activator
LNELTVELLGPPRVVVGQAPLVVDTRKAIAVLALVVVCGDQSREALATMLWPDGDSAHARGALRRTLSVLNAALGPHQALRADRDVVVLDRGAGAHVDVHRFEELLASTGAHGHRRGAVCDACIPALSEAVALSRGEFLGGFLLRDAPDFDAWRMVQAERLRRELTRALDRLTRATAEAGDLEAAAAHLDRWLALDPLNEQAVCRTMLLHAWRGERSEAVRRYRECVALLARELGVAPLPQTTRLYQAILGGRVAAPPEPGDLQRDPVTVP